MDSVKPTIIKKIDRLKNIIRNIIKSNQLYKKLGFIEASDFNSCVVYAETIYNKLTKLLYFINDNESNDTANDNDPIINKLQDIIGEISILISLYGCDTLDNLVYVCIGPYFKIEEKYKEKYKLLNDYVKPLRYTIIDWRSKKKSSNDDILCKTADNFECFEIENNTSPLDFYYRIYGIKFTIHNIEKQHTITICGIVDDSIVGLIDNSFINEQLTKLKTNNAPSEISYERFMNCINLKDIIVSSIPELKNKYIAYQTDYSKLIKKPLAEIISDFTKIEIYEKRNMLIMLLIHSQENQCQYLAYLLYDLLSNDINGIVDTYEQTTIYDSFPYYIKKYFRDEMTQLVTYTNKLTTVNINKISLEQRICLMKTTDIVKEKAMVKLKEVKMKNEDTGSKAMQFLDGLLKIPFEIYKEEPVLKLLPDNIILFSELVNKIQNQYLPFFNRIDLPFQVKPKYTSIEIQKYLPLLNIKYRSVLHECIFKRALSFIEKCNKNKIIEYCEKLNCILKENTIKMEIKYKGKNIKHMKEDFINAINSILGTNETNNIVTNNIVTNNIYEFIETIQESKQLYLNEYNNTLLNIDKNIVNVNNYISEVSNTLDNSVYGHKNAKRQIERIIGQWINGDKTGYCFGFEGPPGVGKTSLAKKGIANCLIDENGESRPFAFIAMGGSTNSSTLDGHNYTYVGSSWGRIVDILMDTKIMNPIIFIDELDKVSKTENGKEIIGILTHLIDQTQNDTFQDKYFNGINLNLSKALFIFSYNDAELIDKILLDRIHRIKFDTINVEDKLVIMRNFILPEIYKKMGLDDMIEISDEVIEYIINDYTAEPGVRKLKELMFEIIGEINLNILKNNTLNTIDIPIIITTDDIKSKYLKTRNEIIPTKIHNNPMIGVINGLWANSLGKGGILPIEASFFPSNTFLDLSLTGLQGDVMKESMTVAKSLAWSLFVQNSGKAVELQKKLEETKHQGLHIHVPEGATPKDGPSAGTAITIVMYSLFSGIPIKNEVAITGEICLQGRVTAIGGLELKILGGIRAGVKTFIYPKENTNDFNKFMEIYGNKPMIADISFISVEKIEEVIPLIF